ncbi:predicted protein [Naegleria gruberi]|uniref:Predicted protein n=1 Tax=Naegleria gruberi TaxID=5762 RepID=D2VY80_NAEGR|nr:uncharacterized protein NAEGRDRAFT_81683 [Naegleria gruberi]EFC38203.1 predicted protein [Naegleria gruberi]|eukprot:XP_002670947.1 predicted protein [Naegleria gruberi strain NEG-M]
MKSCENYSLTLNHQQKSKPSEPQLSQTIRSPPPPHPPPNRIIEKVDYVKFSVVTFGRVGQQQQKKSNSNINNTSSIGGINKAAPKVRGRPKRKILQVGAIQMTIDSTEPITTCSSLANNHNDDAYIRVRRPSEHKSTCTSEDNIIIQPLSSPLFNNIIPRKTTTITTTNIATTTSERKHRTAITFQELLN